MQAWMELKQALLRSSSIYRQLNECQTHSYKPIVWLLQQISILLHCHIVATCNLWFLSLTATCSFQYLPRYKVHKPLSWSITICIESIDRKHVVCGQLLWTCIAIRRLTCFTLHSNPPLITCASVRSCAGPSILTGIAAGGYVITYEHIEVYNCVH